MADSTPDPALKEQLSQLMFDLTRDANALRDKRAATDALQQPLTLQIERLEREYEESTQNIWERYRVTLATFYQLLIENRTEVFGTKKTIVIAGATIKQIPSDVLEITDETHVIRRLEAIGETDLIEVKKTVRKSAVKKRPDIFSRIKKGWRQRKKLFFNINIGNEERPKAVSPNDPFHPSESIYLN